MKLQPAYDYALTVVVVSFNTCDLLRDCLRALLAECVRLPHDVRAEIIVVDNASRDGSADMVEREFARASIAVRLLRSEVNLGFGSANNLAFDAALGQYLVMLNSDAFIHEGGLAKALELMEAHPRTAVGGARLLSAEGDWQPSARCFHTLWIDALVMSGLPARFPKSRIFGAPDRTWANPDEPADVDWVPGAFTIMRREALVQVGTFDPDYFLYYEEVDLMRRIKAAGWNVSYWPQIVVTHIEQASGRQLPTLKENASPVLLWRMRSALLYYRKHYSWQARLAYWMELGFYWLRVLRNRGSKDPLRRVRAEEAAVLGVLMRQAWRDTRGGTMSPPRPW